MSEKRYELNVEMPVGYENLTHLEVIHQDSKAYKQEGNYRVGGILHLGVGDDAYDKKVPLRQPIDLLELYSDHDAKEFEIYKADPEKWKMAQQIKALEARIAMLESPAQKKPSKASSLSFLNRKSNPTTQAKTDTKNPPKVEAKKVDQSKPIDDNESHPDSRWNRTTGWLGNLVTGRSVHAQIMRKATEVNDKKIQVATTEYLEEEKVGYDGYTESDRRAGRRSGALATGALAVGGAVGVGIGYLIWHKTGHNIYHEATSTVTNTEPPQPNANAQQTIEALQVKNQSLSQQVHELSHLNSQPFNPDPAHRLTTTGITGNLRISGAPGHEKLLDGHKVIVKKLEWDKYGLLATHIREHLRSLHYKVSYGQFGINRFKSIVWKP